MEEMDRLDVIFALQKSLDEDIMKRRNLNYSYEEWMQKDALACIEEIMEVLNEVQYKWWKNKKPQDQKAIQEELVDVLHFFVSMCIRSGMDGKARPCTRGISPRTRRISIGSTAGLKNRATR